MAILRRLSRIFRSVQSRKSSTASRNEVLSAQNKLFSAEQSRQRNDVGRIERITVDYEGKSDWHQFVMNRHISTPYHVAQHVSEWATKNSPLALVDGDKIWDMHRPLTDSCSLKFLSFFDPDPYQVNKAFWKSCSFMLGCVISRAFKDGVRVTLHSFPSPQISSGSFLYDAGLSLNDEWRPSANELRVLSSEMVKLANEALPFERLQVQRELAEEIFSSNPYKLKQIPGIAENWGGQVVLYRIGQHIDISRGPLMSDTSLLGRCSITAVHTVESNDGLLYRFQGIALPKGLLLNHFAYKLLEERSSKPNRSSYEHRVEHSF